MPARHTQSSQLIKSLCSFLGSGLLLEGDLLLLEGGQLGELEVHLVGGQVLVGRGHGFEAGEHQVLVEGVHEDGLDAAAFDGHADLAASHVGGGHDVGEDGDVDGLEGAGAGAALAGVVDGCKNKMARFLPRVEMIVRLATMTTGHLNLASSTSMTLSPTFL